jgi:hypothetical protein
VRAKHSHPPQSVGLFVVRYGIGVVKVGAGLVLLILNPAD